MARQSSEQASRARLVAAAARHEANTLDESMDNTVAEIQGVGCTYRIRQVHQAPLYDVEAMSGPVQHVVLHASFWEQAMDFVRDEVAEQLADC